MTETTLRPTAIAAAIMAEIADPALLIRELNHRVKNNFQIILSLMHLRKRMLPSDRRGDTRFIEDHMQAMSVAYRLVYATGSIADIAPAELVADVMSGLRQTAGLDEDRLRVEVTSGETAIGLDHALALALYLAIKLPPYLDNATASGGTVAVTLAGVGELLTLSVVAPRAERGDFDVLRTRLMQAYATQLNGRIVPANGQNPAQLEFIPVRFVPAAALSLGCLL